MVNLCSRFDTLRFSFRKARDDEAAATRRLNEMIANYGDVIPRRDFETLDKTHQVWVPSYNKSSILFLYSSVMYRPLLVYCRVPPTQGLQVTVA